MQAPAAAEGGPAVILQGESAADQAAAPHRRDTAVDVRARIHQLWFSRKASLDASDPVEAQARVEELRAYMQQEGITADRELARGFAYEGYESLREGNYERAREAFDLARSFDPFLPQAQLGYAWSLLRAGRGVVTFVNEYRRGMSLVWAQFLTDEVQISNFAVISALAALGSMLVFSLVVVARCQARLRHDVSETIRRFLPERGARLAAWGVFLLPILAWVGGLWLLLYWLTLCFRYMRPSERAVAVCAFLMLGLSPLGVATVLDRFEASTDPETRVAVAAMQGGYNPETVRRLEDIVASRSDSAEMHLLLGNSYAKGDLLGEAFDEYKIVMAHNPTSTAALVNMGNIYYRLGEFAQAVGQYKQAAQIQPGLLSVYWNLYLAQTDLLHFAEAEANLARARAVDHGLTGRLLARKKGSAGSGLLLEENASLARIKQDLRSERRAPAEEARDLLNPLSLASGAGLILALLLSIGNASRLASACARCGRAHCRRCQRDSGAEGYCSRCLHLFIRKDGITSEMRADGMARLQRRERVFGVVMRAVSLVLPGSRQILAGRPLIGLPVMIGWVSAIVFLFARQRLLVTAVVPVSDLPPPGVVAAVLFMIVFWILGNAGVARRRSSMRMVSDGA